MTPEQQPLNQLVELALSCAETVRNIFGTGLPKECYMEALILELQKHGAQSDADAEVPLIYDGQQLINKVLLDIVVGGQLLLHVISESKIEKQAETQTQAGLRVSNLPIALILNFSAPSIRGDVRRIFNPNHR
ncbi:GxxExxY protein [Planctomycetota bacterium]|nr:GxxExxY protein [Planctomycetota bacterium]